FALIVAPSACEMPTIGIVIDGSEPPIGFGGRPAALFAIITAIAPAACAACAFNTNVQLPRSISAMLPAIAPAFVIASQPSFALAPPASDTNTTEPVTPPTVIGPPNAAPTIAYVPAMPPGAMIRNRDGCAR